MSLKENDMEIIDFSNVENGFEIESEDFSEYKNYSVVPVEEMDKKKKIVDKPKMDYIELDESLINSDDIKKIEEIKEEKVEPKKEETVKVEKTVKPNYNPIIDTIEFDALKGSYVISYHELGNSKTEEYFVGKKDLFENEMKRQEKIVKWGKNNRILRRVDMNLYSVLSKFDIKHNSNCAREYLDNDSQYITNYYMKKVFKNKDYSFKEKIGLIKTANRQKRYRKAETENPKGIYAIPALASFALLVGLLGTTVPSTNKNSSATPNKTKKEIVSNDKEVSLTTALDDLIDDTIKIETTTEEVVSTTKEEVTTEEVVSTTKEEVTVTPVEEKEEFNIKDSFVLDNMTLEYSPFEDIANVNTNNLKNINHYKISLISVNDGNTILYNKRVDSLANKSIKDIVSELHSEFGDEVNIYFNFDGYNEAGDKELSNIGWSKAENLAVKEDYKNRSKIDALKKLKSELLALKDNANTKYLSFAHGQKVR